MWADNRGGTKKITEMELLLCHLKPTIICKSYNIRKNNFCGIMFENATIFKNLLLYSKMFAKLLVFTKSHPNDSIN